MIAPFRVESLNNKLSDMKYNTVESRFLEPSVFWTSRYLEPNHVAIEFASLILHTVVSPPISRTRDFSKLSITRTNFFSFFERFEYHMCINIVFRWQMLANHIALGWRSIITSYSVRLHIENSEFRTLMMFLWQLLIDCFVNLPHFWTVFLVSTRWIFFVSGETE